MASGAARSSRRVSRLAARAARAGPPAGAAAPAARARRPLGARLGRAAGAGDHVDLHGLVGDQLHALRGAREAQQVLPHREAGGVLRARMHPPPSQARAERPVKPAPSEA
jgi:hypothetical protein